MYGSGQILEGVSNPYLIFHETNKLFGRAMKSVASESGIGVLDEDWDNMIILDACRYDIFEEINLIEGELQYRNSLGSSTAQFLYKNFNGRELHDIVYITSNPMVYKKEIDASFHHIEHVWKDHWDDDLYTVHPESMTNRALDVVDGFPNKRVIIHYNQPHHPFIGPTADKYFDFRDYVDPIPGGDHIPFWAKVRRGYLDISRNTFRSAYVETLERTLPHVQDLVAELQGKSVITADHGELLGERMFPIPIRGYGHPPGVRAEEVIKIPWHVMEDGSRKIIEEDEPSVEELIDVEDTATDRLKQLGYMME